MTIPEQLAAFSLAAESKHRRQHTRRDVVGRLRKAIAEGLATYDATTDRVELTAAGRGKVAGLRIVGDEVKP